MLKEKNPQETKQSRFLDFDAFLSDEKAENYLKYAEPTINKAELKKALKQGETFKGVHLSTNSNIQIK